MDSSVCIQAVEDNLVEAWACLSALPEVAYDRSVDRIRYIGGIDFPLCNSIMMARFPREELEERIREALEPIRIRRLPMFWWVGPETRPAGLGDALVEAGLTLSDEIPGMALALSKVGADTPTPTALTYREVRADADLDFWMEIFRSVFELPDFVCDFFRRAMKAYGLAPSAPYQHYLGCWEGRPVSCASVFFSGKTAGIYNVGTLPDFQGRGIGAAMSRYALEAARDRGLALAILHASPRGLPVYRRLGFEEYCRIRLYAWQP